MSNSDKSTFALLKKIVYLHSVFHSIRFKVNKSEGHGGDPFFIS